MVDDEPSDGFERGLRLGCGAVFGLVTGLGFALHLSGFESWFVCATAIAGSVIGCAICAMKYGDQFWEQATRWWWWP